MLIERVVLPTPRPDTVEAFYRNVLTVPTDGGLRLGTTVLELRPTRPFAGSHHLALSLPSDRLPAAKRWLAARTDLLRTPGGDDEVHFDPPFDADSVYFLDPDGTVLELIARRADPPGDDPDAPFSMAEVLRISEVAVAVDSVPDAVERLGQGLGVTPLLEGEDFAAVGDHRGLLILVDPGRAWVPTLDRYPTTEPLEVVVSDVAASASPIAFDQGSRVQPRH
ncbi:VOC family protein [Microlunatus flavus]|uniref:Catechol-2,3-dioxygenase n=1 Tax=Microlunatus flavus TaxID=1036181 RepID=A0A1H9FUK0_9ACTN|nr:hypothetical protein [Microlunatus flavus]SEQ41546.1 Catechol-2,3-dioxygenase [Microlunatus flavus]